MQLRPRPVLSFAAACARARDLLGVEAMAEAVGKSVSLINAWCDPERPEVVPSVRQAALIDHLCVARAGERPLTETLRLMTDRARPGRRADLRDGIADLMAEVGDVARLTRSALSDNRLTAAERAAIAREVEDARAVLDRLLRALADPQTGEVER